MDRLLKDRLTLILDQTLTHRFRVNALLNAGEKLDKICINGLRHWLSSPAFK